ncbi:hypothetical protein AAE478_000859 [Parahypoxylon ruwenzoriense]
MPPPRSLFGDSFICRSCLSALRKRTPSAQWPLRHSSSQASQPLASARPSGLSPEQEAERQKTLETLGLLKGGKGSKLSVKYFEEEKRGGLRRLRDEDEFNRSLLGLDDQSESRLKELEEQLEQATQFTKIVEDIWGKQGAEKLRKRVTSQDESSTPSLLLPEDDWPPQERSHISELNNIIRTIGKKYRGGAPNLGRINSIWKYYTAARLALCNRPELVHADIWDLLWQNLTADHEHNPNRMSHAHILAKDMQKAGVTLRGDQQLLAIEAAFINGFKDDAITAYKKLVTTLGAEPDTFMDFWKLGLRMYCIMGDLARAERVINTILESPYEKDPRFLFPFIRMCASKTGMAEKGYELYRRLRSDLGDSITIEDYDQVISYFLLSNETEFALHIFTEMMTSRPSADLYGTYMLPPTVANPFFFGKWLKRLIGAGDLQGAHNVVLHMRSKGVRPHAIHANVLIGAWLRSGTAGNIQKAEDVGWAMINSRMQFVNIRKDMQGLSKHVRLRQYGDGWPRANLETFSLLAENYKDRGIHSKMEQLWAAFSQAEIPPNSFMLNQLLFSYLQDGQGKHVAALCRDLTNQYRVEPDPWTFMALWQALTVNRLIQVPLGQLPEEISQARSLFAEMVRSAHIFANGIEIHLARFILHSFRKLDDRIGLLLAYRALRLIFKFTPTDFVVLELRVGSMDLERTAKGKAGLRLVHAGKQVERYLKGKHEELIASGQLGPGDEFPADTRSEELGNFLELFLERQVSDLRIENTDQSLREIAMEMGLHGETPDSATTPE